MEYPVTNFKAVMCESGHLKSESNLNPDKSKSTSIFLNPIPCGSNLISPNFAWIQIQLKNAFNPDVNQNPDSHITASKLAATSPFLSISLTFAVFYICQKRTKGFFIQLGNICIHQAVWYTLIIFTTLAPDPDIFFRKPALLINKLSPLDSRTLATSASTLLNVELSVTSVLVQVDNVSMSLLWILSIILIKEK